MLLHKQTETSSRDFTLLGTQMQVLCSGMLGTVAQNENPRGNLDGINVVTKNGRLGRPFVLSPFQKQQLGR
jgi:hypothetical protein